MVRRPQAVPPPPPGAFPPFAAIRAFDAVARLGGVRKAAEALCLHHSAISRHLKSLEQWTGAPLILPSGRGIMLTEAGRRYHERLAPLIDALAELNLAFGQRQGEEKLVIWSRQGIALEWLVPRLDDFQEKHPGLRLEIRPTQVSPDLSRREVDLFIQYFSSYEHPFAIANTAASVEIVRSPILAYASPEYVASHPPVHCPEDLLMHHLLADEQDEAWKIWLSLLGVDDRPIVYAWKFWQPHHALEAARTGQGIILSTRFLAETDIQAGRLVEVQGDQGRFDAGLTGSYWLLGRDEDWNESPRARFRDWIVVETAVMPENYCPAGSE